jgi:CheY-like chemotaxis protein
MRGTLDVTSTPGYGSTFTVRLPRAPDIAPGSAPDPAEQSPARRNAPIADALVVLSIEDNSANSELLARLFQSWPGTTLYAAGSGQLGIDMAGQHPPDLILLDLHLPDLSGEEVFARLRAEPATADIPIVVLSADATPGTIRRLLTRGAVAYLTKPIDLKELLGVLATAGAKGSTTRVNRPSR